MTMQAQKVSISLPLTMLRFVEHYKEANGCSSRSQVIEQALTLLRERELETAYREASAEVDEAWDITIADGLTDETW
jgi:antitoxin ParD1/3/4